MPLNKRITAISYDRLSAIELLRGAAMDPEFAFCEEIAARIAHGGHDDTIWVQAFARYRLLVQRESL